MAWPGTVDPGRAVSPGLNFMRTALLSIAIAFLSAGASRAQPTPPSELSSRAEKILSKNCFACHGNDPTQAHAGLKILDIKDMTARNVLRSKSPDDSELINRIEDGTMPPLGRDGLSKDERDVLRAWVQAGAPAFPDKQVSSTYVLRQIQEDQKKIPSDDRPFVRYFSLNHLRAEKTDEELEEYRSALNIAVAFLSRLPANQVKPLAIDDKTGTIFRIDLRHHGWEKKPHDNGTLNLWDLILLEYPYGVADDSAPSFQRLAEDFLLPAGQVRPVLYVRGDWFVWLATVAAFTNDFLQIPFVDDRAPDPAVDPALVEIASRYTNGRLTLAGAVAELGSTRTEGELRSLLESQAFARNGVRALAAPGGAVERSTWEIEFPLLVQALNLGVSIVPIDATIWPKTSTATALDVSLKTNRPNNVFVGRETIDFLLDNRTPEPAFVELVVIGKWITRLTNPTKVEKGLNKFTEVTPPDDEAAIEDVVLFASPTVFPKYQLIGGGADRYAYDKSRHIRSRIVHPFYRLEASDSGVQLKAVRGLIVRQKIIVETK